MRLVATLCVSLLSTLPALAADPAPAPPDAAMVVQRPAPSQDLAPVLSALQKNRLFGSAKVGFQVVDLQTGEEVYAHGPDASLNPASTMKVVTSATALKVLGPSYRFTTDVYTDGTIDAAGTLQGNLYIEGHGDPSLVIEKLWKLVADLSNEGIERIEGDVVFDDDFHTGGAQLPGWNKPEDISRGPSYFATLSALSLNFNTAAIVVGPGAEVGKKARVRLETPAGSAVTVVNEVKTGAATARRSVQMDRDVAADGTTTFTLRGTVPLLSDHTKYYRTVADPTGQFAGAFQELLEERGIGVGGRFRRGDTPDDADRVLQVRSSSLATILMDMNKLSNNFIAEQVLRTIGAEVEGEGSTEKGLEVVARYLAELGLDPAELNLVNGSGLSRSATLQPSVLTAVLVDMARDPQVGQEFASSLAIAGYDGTLWSRLRDEPGRLRGKTGTIDGVHCLAGYVEDGRGGRYAFAFMVNDHGGRVRSVKDLHDRFARTMFKWGGDAADE
jgi:D-alanyl-D-alanine carboxypeptidase/D-alanyl-D-alanine-endopeptidase (penicillin-binding protein 4)